MTHSYAHLVEDIREIRTELKDIRREMNRNKGFIGGIAWAFGALSIALQIIIQWVKGGGH
ncbi:MAG: hypothetical protein GC134_01925 [Proteobacteria bacterium]|nr:hypothetical protein [Pseudomonadota bacterium]